MLILYPFETYEQPMVIESKQATVAALRTYGVWKYDPSNTTVLLRLPALLNSTAAKVLPALTLERCTDATTRRVPDTSPSNRNNAVDVLATRTHWNVMFTLTTVLVESA